MSDKNSMRQMRNNGTVRRKDAEQIAYEDIHVDPGFNVMDRITGDDEDESLFKYIMDGGILPALEVRPREEGGVWIVDGHRRHHQIGRAIEAGAPLQEPKSGKVWINIVQFTGNDLDRTLRIATSNDGRKLTPLQLAELYQRLSKFNLTPSQIAQKLHKSPSHVEQMLILANANAYVHEMVRSDVISATAAIKAQREHGENTGKYLANLVPKARTVAGKVRITDASMKPQKDKSSEIATDTNKLYQLANWLLCGQATISADGGVITIHWIFSKTDFKGHDLRQVIKDVYEALNVPKKEPQIHDLFGDCED
jgi:ParB family transcriptional regulator, chromosome partitioning protein